MFSDIAQTADYFAKKNVLLNILRKKLVKDIFLKLVQNSALLKIPQSVTI